MSSADIRLAHSAAAEARRRWGSARTRNGAADLDLYPGFFRALLIAAKIAATRNSDASAPRAGTVGRETGVRC